MKKFFFFAYVYLQTGNHKYLKDVKKVCRDIYEAPKAIEGSKMTADGKLTLYVPSHWTDKL